MEISFIKMCFYFVMSASVVVCMSGMVVVTYTLMKIMSMQNTGPQYIAGPVPGVVSNHSIEETETPFVTKASATMSAEESITPKQFQNIDPVNFGKDT